MQRWGWATDIHLNFLDETGLADFTRRLQAAALDGLLLAGDIGESDSVVAYLKLLEAQLARPIYFVLGNHDYYFASLVRVRQVVAAECSGRPHLRYLTGAPALPLSPSTGVIGHDGWADARSGDYDGSEVLFNDYFLIEDLAGLDAAGRRAKLNGLGDEAARALEPSLRDALGRFQHVLLLMHFPPFAAACWYAGRISTDAFLPHLCCTAAGDMMAAVMRAHPDRQLTVLCGHTHGGGEVRIAPNLRVKTGGACYGEPCLQEVLLV